MIKIVFKNLEKSSLAKDVTEDKIQGLIEKFPDLKQHSVHVTISMDNSSSQPGPDEFGIKIQIKGKKFGGLILEKRAKSFYVAIAEACEVLLELLNRRTDKLRVKKRAQLRQAKYLAGSGAEELELEQ